MIRSITTTYVSLYAVPGTLKSMSIFEKYGVYFWGDFTASTFHIEDIKNSEYIGIGKEVHSNEYMNVSYVGKICTNKNSQPIYFNFKTQKTSKSCIILEEGFSNIESDDLKRYKIAEAFSTHIEAFEKENGELKSTTADSWYCIVVDKDNIFKTLDESTFYKSKSTIAFPINIDLESGKYIRNQDMLNLYYLNEGLILDIGNLKIYSKETGKEGNLEGTHTLEYLEIFKAIALSKEKECRIKIETADSSFLGETNYGYCNSILKTSLDRMITRISAGKNNISFNKTDSYYIFRLNKG